MKCVHTFGTGRHKRQADITLLFQYIFFIITTVIITFIEIHYHLIGKERSSHSIDCISFFNELSFVFMRGRDLDSWQLLTLNLHLHRYFQVEKQRLTYIGHLKLTVLMPISCLMRSCHHFFYFLDVYVYVIV